MGKAIGLAVVIFALIAAPFAAQATDIGTVTLMNGDVNGDNSITSSDLSTLLANLDQTGAPGDLDGDNVVTTMDLSIVQKNMNQAGDP